MEYVKCNICNRDNTKLLFKAKDLNNRMNGEFDIVKCQNCGLVYINPRPTKSEIFEFYQDYTLHKYRVKDAKGNKDLFGRIYNSIANNSSFNPFRLKGKVKSCVLDIGCGIGYYLKKLKDEGWETYGVEISPIAVKIGREQFGLDISQGDVTDACFKENFFDVVLMQWSLEHMHDPLSVLSEVRKIIKNNGIFIIGVPNIDGLSARIFKDLWYDLDAPRHLYHFSPKTLNLALEKTGFITEKIIYSPTPATIRNSLNHFFKEYKLNLQIPLAFSFIIFSITMPIALFAKGDRTIFIVKKRIDQQEG